MFLVFFIMLFLLQGVAYITLCERHLLGGSQQRIGPNKVSFFGGLQPIFDGVKLVKKEQLLSLHSSWMFFIVVPGITFLIMYLEWFVIYYFFEFFTLLYGILFFLCLMGFSVYSFLLGGIVSKSKYAFLGAVRVSNQSISYEIIFSFFVISVVIFWGSYMFVSYFSLFFVIFFLFFFFIVLAELSRAPFDFSEGESELVSGYNVEYGSVSYALFYMGEYGSLLFFSFLFSLFFFDCNFFVFYLVFCVFIFIRSSFPRFRYDMMMGFFWLVMLPLSLYFLFFVVVLIL
uniref:NADH-ubiquinone oxidoreductase chain 1 n=1 Tax=Wellcomia siamensis TaxID=435744 RepID=G4V252_WELSI|nr:NADH dehydrogenase subunit 1 [Wellcomia siamensis]ACV96769.1 NADH dehydrogenase subunit 1 [Wellcomia siamensis]